MQYLLNMNLYSMSHLNFYVWESTHAVVGSIISLTEHSSNETIKLCRKDPGDEGGNTDSGAGKSGRNNGKSRRVTSSGCLQRSWTSSSHQPYWAGLSYSLQVYRPVSLLPSGCLSVSPL